MKELATRRRKMDRRTQRENERAQEKAVARGVCWSHLPPPRQSQQQQEGVDSQEALDALTFEEENDCELYHQGQMVKCWLGKAIEDEERDELREHSQMQ